VLSRHAFRRIVERDITEVEIREVGRNAVMLEDYPGDKYSPSCLLLGLTARERPLHIHVSRAEGEVTRIVTIYEPDLDDWEQGFAIRR